MNHLETQMLTNSPNHLKDLIYAWKRFIDDVLLLFLGSFEKLEEFHAYLNSCHPTMKFDKAEYNKDDNSTNFLDLEIRIVENQIVTAYTTGNAPNKISQTFQNANTLE